MMEALSVSPNLDNLTSIVEESVRWSVHHVNASIQRFEWPDYLMFVLMLLICIVIGIYFGFIKTSKTEDEYLMGGRNMNVFPVAMSLIASFISGISLLGIPTEIYIYGNQYSYIVIGTCIMGIIFQIVYLPVFHDLKLTSTFEYLEKRFDQKARIFGSILTIIGIFYAQAQEFDRSKHLALKLKVCHVLGLVKFLCLCNKALLGNTTFKTMYFLQATWLPMVIYMPALAFNQVTGINVHFVTPIVCIICIFYTCVGGLKAVVWADVIQTIIMLGAIVLVAVKGTIDIGGLSVVLQRNLESGRIEAPDFDPSPFKRHSFWTLAIGGMFFMLQASAVNQSMIQRYLALPTLKQANRAVWIFVAGLLVVVSLCSYCGLLIYAIYYSCDPITTQLARQKDQLLPLLVMDVVGNIPGFPGLFIAGIFSAALSSLSTGLNSMVAMVLQDFYRPFFKDELSEKHKQIVMRTLVVVFGIMFIGLVFVVEKLGTVLQLTMTIGTISAGPALALFTLGMIVPWVNSIGAFIGSLAGLIFMTWLIFSSEAVITAGGIHYPEKPVSTNSCTYDFVPRPPPPGVSYRINEDGIEIPEDDPSVPLIYQLSYLWYTLIGTAISCVVAVIASKFWPGAGGFIDPRDIDPALLSPVIRKFIKPRKFPNQPSEGNRIILAYESTEVEVENDPNESGISD